MSNNEILNTTSDNTNSNATTTGTIDYNNSIRSYLERISFNTSNITNISIPLQINDTNSIDLNIHYIRLVLLLFLLFLRVLFNYILYIIIIIICILINLHMFSIIKEQISLKQYFQKYKLLQSILFYSLINVIIITWINYYYHQENIWLLLVFLSNISSEYIIHSPMYASIINVLFVVLLVDSLIKSLSLCCKTLICISIHSKLFYTLIKIPKVSDDTPEEQLSLLSSRILSNSNDSYSHQSSNSNQSIRRRQYQTNTLNTSDISYDIEAISMNSDDRSHASNTFHEESQLYLKMIRICKIIDAFVILYHNLIISYIWSPYFYICQPFGNVLVLIYWMIKFIFLSQQYNDLLIVYKDYQNGILVSTS